MTKHRTSFDDDDNNNLSPTKPNPTVGTNFSKPKLILSKAKSKPLVPSPSTTGSNAECSPHQNRLPCLHSCHAQEKHIDFITNPVDDGTYNSFSPSIFFFSP